MPPRDVAKNVSFGMLYRRGFSSAIRRKTPLQALVEGVFIEEHVEQQERQIEESLAAWDRRVHGRS